MRLLTIILSIIVIIPGNAQKLNEAYLRAQAAMQQKQYAEVTREIQSVFRNERTSAMYFTLGESYYSSNKYSDAVRAFVMADSLKTSPDAQLYIARAYAMTTQPAKSAEWLQKYLGQREKLTESELQLDPALEKIEHSKEWKTLWNKEWYNKVDRKIAEAMVLAKRKKYTEALNIIDVEIANNSSSAKLYALRAKIYEAMEQYEAAFESYNAAIRLRNNNSGYYADAAQLAVRIKKYDVALDDMNRAVRLDPYRLDLYLQRAAVFRMAGRYDEARDDLNFYFKYLPSDAKAIYQLGIAEIEAGNALAGIEYFTTLIDRDQTSADYYMARASAYIKTDSYKMANEDLSQVLDLNPKQSEAWLQKGIMQYKLNDTENACYYWRKALDLGNKDASGYIYKYCIKYLTVEN